MSILEDNKLIAEFMGLDHRIERHDIFYMPAWKPGIGGQAEGSLIYRPDTDWNQLMEVVEKIRNEGCIVDISFILGTICKIHKPSRTPMLIASVEDNDPIQAVYQAVLEYIKQKEN